MLKGDTPHACRRERKFCHSARYAKQASCVCLKLPKTRVDNETMWVEQRLMSSTKDLKTFRLVCSAWNTKVPVALSQSTGISHKYMFQADSWRSLSTQSRTKWFSGLVELNNSPSPKKISSVRSLPHQFRKAKLVSQVQGRRKKDFYSRHKPQR